MSNRSKRLDEIRAEAERFFEWPGDDRSTVTLTSCILFADHIADALFEGLETIALESTDEQARWCAHHYLATYRAAQEKK